MNPLVTTLLILLAALAACELVRFWRLGILSPFPSGSTPDNAANFGLMGLWQNANVYCGGLNSITTAGTDSALTAAQALSRVLAMAAGASGGFTITLPTTKAMLAAIGPCVPTDGSFSFPVGYLNVNVGQTGTLTAGDASTTVSGTATIATNTRRDFMVTVASATTLTFTNIGSAAI